MGFVRKLMDILGPRWKHSDWEIRAKAVQMLKDQAVLAKIAANDQHWEIRKAAVMKLLIPTTLKAIAAGDQNEAVRVSAAERIKALVLDSVQCLKTFNSGDRGRFGAAVDAARILGALGDKGSSEILIGLLKDTMLQIYSAKSMVSAPPTDAVRVGLQLWASEGLSSLLKLAGTSIDAIGQLADPRANEILLAIKDRHATVLCADHEQPMVREVRDINVKMFTNADGTDKYWDSSLCEAATEALKGLARTPEG